MARITVPYAVADFEEMRERGFYYVDKTDYIPGLEDYKAPVFLRPRRFGKSLLISMLASYYDRTKVNRFEELFGGTWIGEHPTKEHNQYLVIRYDFSAMVMADDMQGLAQNFDKLNCIPVEITLEHNRDLFGDFQFTTRGNAAQMLEELLGYARSHGFPKAYILIDEYDNFTNQLLTSYNDPLYEEVTTSDSFLRTFFKVIKKGIGEGSIRTCFCTGVLPVTMDDLTSGSGQVAQGASDLATGAGTLKKGAGDLATGAGQVADGATTLHKGASDLSDGLNTLDGGIGQLKEKAGSLSTGADQLKSGTDQLATGASTLVSNNQKLNDGAGTLSDGTDAIIDGVGELSDGAHQLADGITEFSEDGIDEIINSYNGDIEPLVDRIQAVLDAGADYQTYTDIADGVNGSVKFIIKTDAVKAED